MTSFRAFVIPLLLTLAVHSPAHAQTFGWTGGGTSSFWSQSANWGGFPPPPSGSLTTVLFFASGSSNYTPINNLGTFNLQSLFVADGTPYTISGGTLRFGGSSPILNAFSGTHTINSSINLQQPLEIAASSQLDLNGAITGLFDITKTGAGLLVLDGENGGWSGDLDIQRGTVRFDPGDALGPFSDVHVAAGAIADFSPGSEGFGGISGAGHVEFGDAANFFSNFNFDQSFSGTMSGANAHLRKQGGGTFHLTSGANASIDRLTVESGAITVGSGAVVTTTGATNVDLGTTLTLANGSTYNSGGSMIVRGTLNTSGNNISLPPSFINSLTVREFAIWNLDSSGDFPTKFTNTIVNVLGSAELRLSGDVTFDNTFFNVEDGDLLDFANTGVTIRGRNNAQLNIALSDTLVIDRNATIDLATGADLRAGSLRVGRDGISQGTVLVDGSGTLIDTGILDIGFEGPGMLTITGGASVVADLFSSIGDDSTGVVTVVGGDGAGNPSRFSAKSLILGDRPGAIGRLEVMAGAEFNAGPEFGELLLGNLGNGTLIVDGKDAFGNPSRMTSTTSMRVTLNPQGEGEFSVSGGAIVNLTNLIIGGFNPSNQAVVNLRDADSRITLSSTLFVGGTGSAVLNLEGGLFTIGTASVTIRGMGKINLTGGIFDAASAITVGDEGEVNLDGGVLRASSLALADNGSLNFRSGRLSVENYQASLVNSGGILAPGAPIGQTVIQGDYTQQASASLEIEIGGTTPVGDYDLVGVTGSAILDGDLLLKLVGFTPDPSDTFTVLNSTNIFGAFDNVLTGQRLNTAGGGGSFRVHYGADSEFDETQIVLSDFVTNLLPGDYNADGFVDAADYTVWRDNLGAAAGALPNDPDGGVISAAQYTRWKNNFGAVSSGAGAASAFVADPSRRASSQAVPEPAAGLIVLTACGCVMLTARKRVRRMTSGHPTNTGV